MIQADLHIHSWWSDGSLSPAQIIKFGKMQGLTRMAVTDHDTMEGQDEVMEQGRRQGMAVIPGIEISAYQPKNGRKIHILGYGMTRPEKINKVLRPYLEERDEAARKALARVWAAGYRIDDEDVSPYLGKGGILYRQHIMHALIDRGYDTAIYGPLYQKLFGKDGIAMVKSSYIPAAEAVRLVLECGGQPVLAHPFQYDSADSLPELAAAGLAGIECWHPTQTKQRQAQVKKLAAQYNLFLTGGSDAHGLYTEWPDPIGGIGCERIEKQLEPVGAVAGSSPSISVFS